MSLFRFIPESLPDPQRFTASGHFDAKDAHRNPLLGRVTIGLRSLVVSSSLIAFTAPISSAQEPAGAEAPVAQQSSTAATESVSDEELRDIIGRLGANSFQVREAATARILEVGPRCLPALRREAELGDKETRQRVSVLIERLTKADFEQRVEAFLKFDPEKTLPGWDYVAGKLPDTLEIREMFVSIYRKHPAYAELLGGDAADRAEALRILTQDLGDQRMHLGFIPSADDFAALLLVMTDDAVTTTDANDTEVIILLRRFEIADALRDPKLSTSLRKLIAAWLPKVNQGHRENAIYFALQSDFPEILPLANKVIATQKDDVDVLQYAIKAIAKFGTPQDALAVKPLLDDERAVGDEFLVYDPTGQIVLPQVRDLAMAAVAITNDRKLRDIGFPRGEEHPNLGFLEESLTFPAGEVGQRQRERVMAEVVELLEAAEQANAAQ